MEKGRPHRKLSVVKALVDAGKVRAAFSALSGAAEMEFDFEEMADVVMLIVSFKAL